MCVDEFTDQAQWAHLTADINGLGKEQYLLAVATGGHQYFISGGEGRSLQGSQISSVREDLLLPSHDGDWARTITAVAKGVEEEQTAPDRTTTIAVGTGAAILGARGAAFGIVRTRRKHREQRAEREEIERLGRLVDSVAQSIRRLVQPQESKLQRLAQAQRRRSLLIEDTAHPSAPIAPIRTLEPTPLLRKEPA